MMQKTPNVCLKPIFLIQLSHYGYCIPRTGTLSFFSLVIFGVARKTGVWLNPHSSGDLTRISLFFLIIKSTNYLVSVVEEAADFRRS